MEFGGITDEQMYSDALLSPEDSVKGAAAATLYVNMLGYRVIDFRPPTKEDIFLWYQAHRGMGDLFRIFDYEDWKAYAGRLPLTPVYILTPELDHSVTKQITDDYLQKVKEAEQKGTPELPGYYQVKTIYDKRQRWRIGRWDGFQWELMGYIGKRGPRSVKEIGTKIEVTLPDI
jgi:hypothetical protein